MTLLNDNQKSELLDNPKRLLNNYEKLLNCIGTMVDTVNSQISFTPDKESICYNKLLQHRDIITRMRIAVRKEMDLFSDYIDILCEREEELDIDGTYKQQRKLCEKLLQDDTIMLQKLINGEKEYVRTIKGLQEMFNKLEEK